MRLNRSDRPAKRERRLPCCCFIVLVMLGVTAIDGFYFVKRLQEGFVVAVPAERIQKALEPAFPVVKKSGIVRVTLTDPRVILKRGSNRIGILVTARVDVFGKKATTGEATADGTMSYDPKTTTLTISDVRARSVTIDHIDRSLRRTATRLAKDAVQAELPKSAVYQMTDSTLIERAVKFAVRSVKVEDGQVDVTLGP